MCITEYNEEQHLQDTFEEGKIETLFSLIEKGIISYEQAADEAGMSLEEFKKMSV